MKYAPSNLNPSSTTPFDPPCTSRILPPLATGALIVGKVPGTAALIFSPFAVMMTKEVVWANADAPNLGSAAAAWRSLA